MPTAGPVCARRRPPGSAGAGAWRGQRSAGAASPRPLKRRTAPDAVASVRASAAGVRAEREGKPRSDAAVAGHDGLRALAAGDRASAGEETRWTAGSVRTRRGAAAPRAQRAPGGGSEARGRRAPGTERAAVAGRRRCRWPRENERWSEGWGCASGQRQRWVTRRAASGVGGRWGRNDRLDRLATCRVDKAVRGVVGSVIAFSLAPEPQTPLSSDRANTWFRSR